MSTLNNRGKKCIGTFLEAPIVQSTMKTIEDRGSANITHKTAVMSNWRAINDLDSHEEKQRTFSSTSNVVRSPTYARPEVENMKRSFQNYEAYKKDY
jgi:hypothetical protein